MNVVIWIVAGGVVGWIACTALHLNVSRGLVASVTIGIIAAFFGGHVLAPIFGATVGETGAQSLRAAWAAPLPQVVSRSVTVYDASGRVMSEQRASEFARDHRRHVSAHFQRARRAALFDLRPPVEPAVVGGKAIRITRLLAIAAAHRILTALLLAVIPSSELPLDRNALTLLPDDAPAGTTARDEWSLRHRLAALGVVACLFSAPLHGGYMTDFA